MYYLVWEDAEKLPNCWEWGGGGEEEQCLQAAHVWVLTGAATYLQGA